MTAQIDVINTNNMQISRSCAETRIYQPNITNVNAKYIWSAVISGTSNIKILSMSIDDNSNIYVLSQIYNDDPDNFITINPANGHNHLILKMKSVGNIILTKYDKFGEIIFATQIIQYDGNINFHMKCQKSNIIIAGHHVGSFKLMDIFSNIYTEYYSDSPESIIIKITNELSFAWTSLIKSTSFGKITDFSVDIHGNIYVIGSYSGHLRIKQSLILDEKRDSNILDESIGTNIFMIKYNTIGNILWATQMGNYSSIISTENIPNSIFVMNNIIAVVGTYTTNILNFYNVPNGSILSGHGLENSSEKMNGFLAIYDLTGSIISSHQIKQNILPGIMSVAIDSIGHIYLTSNYESIHNLLPSTGIYLAKYHHLQGMIWDIRITNGKNGILSINNIDEIIMTANYDNIVRFESPNQQILFKLTNQLSSNTFIAKINKRGFTQWVAKQSNTFGNMHISISNLNDIYIGGNYRDYLRNYDSTGTIVPYSPFGINENVFVTKYTEYVQTIIIYHPFHYSPNKLIILDSNTRYTTIVFAKNSIIDRDMKMIDFIVFKNIGSFVQLLNNNFQWEIGANQDIELVYVKNNLINY